MRRLAHLTPGKIAALATAGIVLLVLAVNGGDLFSPGDLNAENHRNLQRGGVSSHAEIRGNCSACHAPPWSGETMADRCMACHTEIRHEIEMKQPVHGTLSAGTRCQSCHTEHRGAHAALTDLSRFDHNCAAFKLDGKHTSVSCNACHTNNVYKGTVQSCVGCHGEPKVPQVHKFNYGTGCAQCHNTTTWNSPDRSGFDHSRTAFKLTGKHTAANCNACHKNEVFKGTPMTCVSCHSEPKVPQVHKFNYGSNCAQCHTTATFKTPDRSSFDHNRTAFKLTGKHTAVSCNSCHKNEVFKGTPMTCVGCHSEPKAPQVHKYNYGNKCADCHTTATWTGSTFKHSAFPINHGKRNGNTCATCHQSAENFKLYTCYNCHEHKPDKIAQKHIKKGIVDFQNCIKCHGSGRRREREKIHFDSELVPGCLGNAHGFGADGDCVRTCDGGGCLEPIGPHSHTGFFDNAKLGNDVEFEQLIQEWVSGVDMANWPRGDDLCRADDSQRAILDPCVPITRKTAYPSVTTVLDCPSVSPVVPIIVNSKSSRIDTVTLVGARSQSGEQGIYANEKPPTGPCTDPRDPVQRGPPVADLTGRRRTTGIA